jgi:hypothetical protein
MRHTRDQHREEAEDLKVRVQENPVDGNCRRSEIEPRRHPDPERCPGAERGSEGGEREGAIDGRLGRHRPADGPFSAACWTEGLDERH